MIFRKQSSSIKKTNFISQENLIKSYGLNSFPFTGRISGDRIQILNSIKTPWGEISPEVNLFPIYYILLFMDLYIFFLMGKILLV